MSSRITILSATIKIRLPIVCTICGVESLSDLIDIESACTTVEELSNRIKHQQLGTAFPVGWSNHYTKHQNILKCPECT